MKAPLLVLLAASASASVGAKRSPPSPPPQAQIVVCNNGTKVEPSLHEIIQSLLPHDLPADQLATLQALYEGYFKGQRRGGNIISQRLMEFALSVVDRASRLTVPLRSFVSDGAFTVDMTTDWFYFRDVLLVQENFWAINALCAFIPPQLAAVRAVLCKCFVGEQLSPRDAVIASSRFSNIHAGNAHQWCVRNPCTDRSTRDGRCAVVVDPFRTSCILIPQSAVPAAIATSSSSSSSSSSPSSSSSSAGSSSSSPAKILAGAYSAQQTALRAASAAASKSKHFVDTNGDVLSVSPEVIASMIAGALEKGDDETLHLVITEADRVGQVRVCPSSLSSI